MRRGEPPYWQQPFYDEQVPADKKKIVDTTGAGNAFLGGFAIGYLQNNDILEASQYGAVASSFTLEQVGLPLLTRDGATGQELWNDDSPWKRLDVLEGRSVVQAVTC
jgi:sugar/nucleoside kinase (ribokinase family)